MCNENKQNKSTFSKTSQISWITFYFKHCTLEISETVSDQDKIKMDDGQFF